MPERLKLLKHHVDGIERASYYNTIDDWGANLHVRLVILPHQRQTFIQGTDELAYPALEDKKQQEVYIRASIRAILAVNTGSYEEIPKEDPKTGEKNHDIICDACGNRENGLCNLGDRITASTGEELKSNSLEFRPRW